MGETGNIHVKMLDILESENIERPPGKLITMKVRELRFEDV
jgi:hypothetical protein